MTALPDQDRTFDRTSKMASKRWVAVRLGRAYDWFIKNRESLEAAGFPTADRVLGLYIKADVDAWIEARRQKSDGSATQTTTTPTARINTNAL
jgi:hypothetical protein